MIKKIGLICTFILIATNSWASAEDYFKYFKIDMEMELPNPQKYIKKIMNTDQLYNRGYTKRFKMNKFFKKEFSKTIKSYGMSEGRIKSSGEEEIMGFLNILPKEYYQYIGPLLHQMPGMSEKILNLPGIKETKNKFPKDIADEFKGIENIEHISPGMYLALIPKKNITENLDQPKKKAVRRPERNIVAEVDNFLKQKELRFMDVASKEPASANIKKKSPKPENVRTKYPSLVSPLTQADVKAFSDTIDELNEFGGENKTEILSQLILAEYVLDEIEKEKGIALNLNTLKDLVSPCKRMILKLRLAGLYDDFALILKKYDFTPEGWAYIGDRVAKAQRVLNGNLAIAAGVRYHRRGYYNDYIQKLPQAWQSDFYETQATLIEMYSVLEEDVEAVRPYKKQIDKKLNKNDRLIMLAPIY